MGELEFDPKDWEEIHRHLKEWDEWQRKKGVGRPDFTTDAIYLVLFTIALIKSQNKIEKLTWALIVLTIILVFIGIIQVVTCLGT